MIGHAQIECGRDVHDGKRSAGVTAPSRMQSDQIVTAHQVGGIFQLFNGIRMTRFAVGGVPQGHDWLLPSAPGKEGGPAHVEVRESELMMERPGEQ